MGILNRFRILNDFTCRKDLVSGSPVEIGIEMTNRCNLRCRMCAREAMTRPVGDMPLALLKQIVDEVRPYAEMVYLHGDGEPLLHRQIFEAIEYVKKSGLKVGLSSNATLLDEKASGALLASGLDYLILALDGATKETYERIRVNGRYEQVVENTERFLERKRKEHSGMCVLIQFIMMEENRHEARAFVEHWKKFRPDVIRIKPYVNLLGKKQPVRHRWPCFYLWRQTMIDWDGTVFPCCVDTDSIQNLGNVAKTGLAGIWNGKALREMRQKHIHGRQADIDICRTCDMPLFNPASALAASLVDGYRIKRYLPYWERLAGAFSSGPR